MDEVCDVVLPHPECDAKNLFVRDDKKREYFLITVKGNKRVDLKEFRKAPRNPAAIVCKRGRPDEFSESHARLCNSARTFERRRSQGEILP